MTSLRIQNDEFHCPIRLRDQITADMGQQNRKSSQRAVHCKNNSSEDV